jgi:hypothetical protein
MKAQKAKVSAEMRSSIAQSAQAHVDRILREGGSSPHKLARDCDPLETWSREAILGAAGVESADDVLYIELERGLRSAIRSRALAVLSMGACQ